jgi:hypothetical protein
MVPVTPPVELASKSYNVQLRILQQQPIAQQRQHESSNVSTTLLALRRVYLGNGKNLGLAAQRVETALFNSAGTLKAGTIAP